MEQTFITINNGKFSFELWENKFSYNTMNYLYIPEFILNIHGEPFVYTLDISYILGKRILELKALKLYISSYKDLRFNSFEDVLEKIKDDILLLAEPKYLKINIYGEDKVYSKIINNNKNFTFNNFLTSNFIKYYLPINIDILFFKKVIVNINLPVPIICDIYLITDGDIKRIKGEFLKTIIMLKNENLESEKIAEFTLNKIKSFLTNFEVIVVFNVRGNIKKIKSLYHGNLLSGRDYYIEQIISNFSSYTN